MKPREDLLWNYLRTVMGSGTQEIGYSLIKSCNAVLSVFIAASQIAENTRVKEALRNSANLYTRIVKDLKSRFLHADSLVKQAEPQMQRSNWSNWEELRGDDQRILKVCEEVERRTMHAFKENLSQGQLPEQIRLFLSNHLNGMRQCHSVIKMLQFYIGSTSSNQDNRVAPGTMGSGSSPSPTSDHLVERILKVVLHK